MKAYANAHLSTAAIIHIRTVCTSTAAELAIEKKREFIMGPVGPTVLLYVANEVYIGSIYAI